MWKNAKVTTAESKSLKKQPDWLPLLTGGLVSSSAVGWCLYRSLKSQQLDNKEMMWVAACLAGGIGASSALFYMCRKSTDDDGKSTPIKDVSNSITRDKNDLLSVRFARIVKELDRRYEVAKEREDLHKTSVKNIQEAAQVPFASEYMTRLEKMETCSDEVMGSQKAKFKEVILSSLNELKGYVQGTLDPLPSARNNKFWTTETSDEVRQYGVMIVKEYTNSMLPRIEQAIDEFVSSVYKAEKVLDYDMDLKIKACEDDPQPKSAFASNIQPFESNQSREKIPTVTSEFSPLMPKSASPNSRGDPFILAETGHPEAEITKNIFSNPPAKWTREQVKDFLFLKTEDAGTGCP